MIIAAALCLHGTYLPERQRRTPTRTSVRKNEKCAPINDVLDLFYVTGSLKPNPYGSFHPPHQVCPLYSPLRGKVVILISAVCDESTKKSPLGRRTFDSRSRGTKRCKCKITSHSLNKTPKKKPWLFQITKEYLVSSSKSRRNIFWSIKRYPTQGRKKSSFGAKMVKTIFFLKGFTVVEWSPSQERRISGFGTRGIRTSTSCFPTRSEKWWAFPRCNSCAGRCDINQIKEESLQQPRSAIRYRVELILTWSRWTQSTGPTWPLWNCSTSQDRNRWLPSPSLVLGMPTPIFIMHWAEKKKSASNSDQSGIRPEIRT